MLVFRRGITEKYGDEGLRATLRDGRASFEVALLRKVQLYPRMSGSFALIQIMSRDSDGGRRYAGVDSVLPR
jgi:hypothetical protein